MTKEYLAKAINDIDIALIDQALVARPKSTKRKILKYGSIAAAFALIFVGFVITEPMIKNFVNDKIYLLIEKESGGEYQSTAHKKPAVIGNGYTEQQIREYVESNKSTIAFAVAAEYGCTDDITVNIKGYCHASLGKKNTVDRDYLTLPIMQNGKIIASMTVFKVNNEMTNTINIGGDTWESLNEAFRKDSGELVFVFAGGVCETVIVPDNSICEIVQGGGAFLDGGVDWYGLLKTPYNTFSRAELYSSKNCITITGISAPSTNEDEPESTVSFEGEAADPNDIYG